MKVTDEIRSELDRLAAVTGTLTEDAVVEASKEADSPLHSMFLWGNDAAAAQLGRLEIARRLIVSVRILPETAQALGVNVEMRKFHGTGDGYKDLQTLMNKDELRRMLLRSALRELQSLQRRYSQLTELAAIFESAGKLKEELAA